MVLAVRILGLQRDQNQARRRFPIIIPMRFEWLDILINKGFLERYKRIWPVYCLRYNSR